MSDLGQRLIDIVRSKAAEHPDHIYNAPEGLFACQYVHYETDDQPAATPGYLIGQALWDTGLIDSSFPEGDNTSAFIDLPTKYDWQLDQDEIAWLRRAQEHQDHSHSWASAITFADTEPFS